MAIQFILLLVNIVLINVGFIISFIVRYGLSVPGNSIGPFKNNFMFLTTFCMLALTVFGVYKNRFISSWDLFKRIFSGLFIGVLNSVALVYVFRMVWGTFPTSVFIISFFINLFLIFKFNQLILKLSGRIEKRVLVIGKGGIDGLTLGKAIIRRIKSDNIEDVAKYTDIDEVIICDIPKEKDMGLVTYITQKLKANVIFSPVSYMKLIPERINSNNYPYTLATFISRKRDSEEAMLRYLDIAGCIVISFFAFPIAVIVAILIKLTSKGSVFYKQQRVGKDGIIFTLYKFRTMVEDAEKLSGFLPASENDSRVTKIGQFLRVTRLDELPQLFNVLKAEMSLVGPRPENLYRVNTHKVLKELRLSVKPGLTGLAQIRDFRNAYDLHPKHKIKYDYLYIQRRSLFLNLYILAKTVPIMFLKKGR